MKAVQDLDILDGNELEQINRVWVHQQVLFLSNVLDAGGKYIDKRYLVRREEGAQ
jgi:hypothetical protein